MRYKLAAVTGYMGYLVVGLVQVAGVAGVITYATEPDSYYMNGTTHWEHASKNAAASYAIGAMVIASAIALLFIAMGLVPQWRRGGLAVIAGVAYVIALWAAFFWLTIGH